MPNSLRVVGPNFSALCPLDPAGSEVIIGRDPSCHVVLPDPKRNVSRRHLALWTQSNKIYFRVISTVSGVTTSLRKYAPGESGELQVGHFLKFSDYTMNTEETSSTLSSLGAVGIGSAVSPDPWAEMDSQWAGAPQTMAEFPASSLEPDPFSDWDVDAPNPNPKFAPSGTALLNLSPDALPAFLLGLGVQPSTIANFNQRDLETLGKRIRNIVQAIISLEASMEATQAKLGLKHSKQTNPLIGNQSPSQKLAFLLSTGAIANEQLNPDDALNDLVIRLHAHDSAMMAATRATAMGVLTELDPVAIKAKFDKTGSYLPLLVNGKLWEFFGQQYESIGANLPKWLGEMISRHFAPYYSREYEKNRK